MEKNDLKVLINLNVLMCQLSEICRFNFNYEVIVIAENFKENHTFLCLHNARAYFIHLKHNYYVIQYLLDNLDQTITFWVYKEE